ncbi:aminotransferase class V-fold PLP-dependent enzyme [Kibdelosporangium phytohabitans]|uniref:Aminotransferase class V n=1 Tax=Kibdelosporangium phytohabitans TaxID=860235 RepID=A0A0N9IK33_9PSEU|nr:aminotransferase class V-fold PLP-dependent enzyme [Kibdelosporangium phytohabitans]ALG15510.1 aminotransferase class V [Kibdelosporangium phytohabitans]MBE1464498.1 selenocysteine lyase/cysteine desulfurase [Kibdelosporangium phytohabitans]
MIDLDAIRADTPGCRDLVFLDNAGSSLPPRQVLDEVQAHLRREAEVGGYRAAAERAEDLEEGYAVFAELLGCEPHEVAFTDSATRSWLAAVDAMSLSPGDRVLVTEVEYHSNALGLLNLGIKIERIPSDPSGRVDVDALRDMLDSRVRLVSLVHVPTNGGLVNPIEPVVEAAHSVGALVLLDACQSIGQLPVDAAALGVDVISGTGRKWLRGPRGTGVLVIRDQTGLRPRLIDGKAAVWEDSDTFTVAQGARAFELWEYGVAERLGLIAAAKYALRLGISEITAAVSANASLARSLLAGIPGVTLHDLGGDKSGIVSFTKAGRSVEEVRDRLWDKGIAVSCSYSSSTRYDMTRRGIDAVVRASPHYFVSPEQVSEFARALTDV